MEHGFTLISTLAVGFGAALLLGYLAERIKIPALVGYLVAGIAISPATPGFVGDVNLAQQLSEVGVMLLMFGVGLHFSLTDLLRVKYIAVPGAILQMSVATLLGMVCAHLWGWPWGQALVFGLCLSCASTVVLLKALEAKGILESHDGQVAVGWLVVEDIMTVLILVVLPALAPMLGGHSSEIPSQMPLWEIIFWTIARVFGFIALMMIVGKRLLPWLLQMVAKTGSRELFTLSVLASAVGIAYGAAQVFDVSFALGAFFSGMVMRESRYAHRAAMESLPLRDAFAVIFFVGVGMMFDPRIIVDQPLYLLSVLGIIIFGKSIVAFILVIACRYPLHTALTVSAALAQIGEFSFILAALGISLGLLTHEGMSLVLAGSIISIAFNPLAFAAVKPLRNFIKKHWSYARKLDARIDPLALMPDEMVDEYIRGHVVIVGYGERGKFISSQMGERKIPYVVLDQDRSIVEDLRSKGISAICGDAADGAVLIQGHVQDAAMLVLTLNDEIVDRKILETAKLLNPKIIAVFTLNDEEEAKHLEDDKLGKVFIVDEVLGDAVASYAMKRFGKHEEETRFVEERAQEKKAIERGAR